MGAKWDHTTYRHRLNWEQARATDAKGIRRLSATLRDVEAHLTATQKDEDVDGWIALLRKYESVVATVGRKHEFPSAPGSSTLPVTGGRSEAVAR